MSGHQPGTGDADKGRDPYAPTPPAFDIAESLRAPISRGFALTLAVLLLLALVWVDHRQQARLDQVEQYTSSAVSMSTQFVPPSGADPATCWLLGTLANAQGQGALVAQ